MKQADLQVLVVDDNPIKRTLARSPQPPATETTAKPLILAVDDCPEILRLLQAMLGREGFEVMLATDGMAALRLARIYAPQLILLDLHMPQLDGHQVCRMLKDNPDTRDIPVIFVTGESDPQAELHAFGLGGADFIAKPINRPALLARVRNHIGLYRQRKSLQRMFDGVIEFAPDAYLLSDAGGQIVRANVCAEILFGRSQQELLGQSLQQLIAGLQFNGQSVVHCQHSDGSTFSADLNATTLKSEAGDCQMVVLRNPVSHKPAQAPGQPAAAAAAQDPMLLLSQRERQISGLLVSGATVNAIASALCISNKTVSTHKIRILHKLKLTNVPDLVRLCLGQPAGT